MILYKCNGICNIGHQSLSWRFRQVKCNTLTANFHLKKMCKIEQIICMIENFSPDLHSVENDV